MKRIIAFAALALVAHAALADVTGLVAPPGGTGGGVAVSGTVTSGHCTEFLNSTTIQDAGAGCGTSSMVYPAAGIAVSTGSAWASAITTLAELNTELSSSIPSTAATQTWTALQTFGTDISIGGVTPTGATGTGALVFGTSPALTTPNIGAATGTSLSVSGQLTSTAATGTAPLSVASTTNVPNLNASSVLGFTLPCTVPTLVSGDYLTNNGTTCSWSAGSGSGITLQTKGTNNLSQTTLNLVGAGNISVTNPTGGTVDIGPITEPIGNGGAPITSLPYTLPSTESGYQEVVNSSAAGAINVPPASGAFAKAQFDISNYGSGTVTLTPLAIATPGTPTLSTATTGGTIAAGTYNVAVSALDASGQTLVSTNASIATTGSTSTITVTNPGVAYATSYNIWISTSAIGNGTTGVAYENVAALGSGVTLTAIPATTATTQTANTTASTINNATSIPMAPNTQCGLNSDNTNWQVIGCTALGAAVQPESLGFALPSVAQNITQYGMTGSVNTSQAASAIATFNGTLKNLYVYTANAPASGQTFTFTIYVGTPGSMTATGITCQITSAATNPCSNLTNSASITAGQAWSLQIVTSATSGATGPISVGLELN